MKKSEVCGAQSHFGRRYPGCDILDWSLSQPPSIPGPSFLLQSVRLGWLLLVRRAHFSYFCSWLRSLIDSVTPEEACMTSFLFSFTKSSHASFFSLFPLFPKCTKSYLAMVAWESWHDGASRFCCPTGNLFRLIGRVPRTYVPSTPLGAGSGLYCVAPSASGFAQGRLYGAGARRGAGSSEGAEDCSPPRERWVRLPKENKPRSGRKKPSGPIHLGRLDGRRRPSPHGHRARAHIRFLAALGMTDLTRPLQDLFQLTGRAPRTYVPSTPLRAGSGLNCVGPFDFAQGRLYGAGTRWGAGSSEGAEDCSLRVSGG
jgi:hypothetical protein